MSGTTAGGTAGNLPEGCGDLSARVRIALDRLQLLRSLRIVDELLERPLAAAALLIHRTVRDRIAQRLGL